MHRDLVEDRNWISEEDYKEGLALAQLAPGPLAAQLGIYLRLLFITGYKAPHSAGFAFVIPSFINGSSDWFAYKMFGGLPWMQAIFYGVGAAVVGIIVMSSYKLTIKSVGKFKLPSIKQSGCFGYLFIAGIAVTLLCKIRKCFIICCSRVIYMFVKAPPQWIKKYLVPNRGSLLLLAFGNLNGETLGKIAWFFTKAGAFVFGSGLAIVPFYMQA